MRLRRRVVRVSAFTPSVVAELIEVWNAAAGDSFPLREALFRQNTVDDPHFDPAGCLVGRAVRGDLVTGFCLAKVARVPLGADGLRADRGWISMLAVHPDSRRRGVGTALLRAGEAFLRAHGRRRFVLGSDPAHFFPGVPDDTGAAPFFEACGYTLRGDAYDLRRRLRGYETPPAVAAARGAHPDVEIRPLEPRERAALLAFLDATFPGRWRYTVARFLDGGGPIGDVMGVVRGSEVLGFAHLFPPDARWLGPSVAWSPAGSGGGAASRVAGLGPMGVSPAIRGRGLGLALLDRSAAHLAALGAEEMVIDWTDLLGFYGKLGFTPYRRYRHGERNV
ncbi:MAG TPA: GNAT family N-acetyltransferase [bacterium]|nr:GNAT family N-acetyltransferase [bacterium]